MINNLLKAKNDLDKKSKIIDEIVCYLRGKSGLSDREEKVMVCRLDKNLNLYESGLALDITRNKVRIIEKSALNKMANSKAWSHSKTRKHLAALDLFDGENYD